MLISIRGIPMRTVLGPFHPHLEDALVEEIHQYRTSYSLDPLLIAFPSDSLRRRIKVLLAAERGLKLLNLHLLSFHQLSLRLHEERCGGLDAAIRDDAFLEEILRQLIRAQAPGAAAFAGVEEQAGGCAALWQTLRDLKDGMVDPARALEALSEGHFGREGQEKLSSLFTLFETFLSCCKKWQVRDYSDLDIVALEQVPHSQFLKQFSRILYYGFYDLTQVQVDLLHAISRRYPTTLFFPLIPMHPAWAFAQRFYERYVQGLSGECEIRGGTRDAKSADLSEPSPALSLFVDGAEDLEPPRPQKLSCTIVNCSGSRDEVLTVAKEILRLVSDKGAAFHEIGVVARTLQPYVPWIKEIFSEHRIPMATWAEVPVAQFPLAKAVLQIMRLPSSGYLRSYFVDLVASPFFQTEPFCRNGSVPRPDLWDLLTRRLGITKGLEEWRRLERHLDRGMVLTAAGEEDENPQRQTVTDQQIRILWNLFGALHRDLAALPGEASWSEYASRWKLLLKKYLGIAGEEKNGVGSQEEEVRGKLLDTLESLAALDAISPEASLDYFTQTYQRWLERATIPLADGNIKGVAVLDAMAARGIPFRTLFVLGLNEGMFPRTIREDAFLRDRHRRVLETVLGDKVSEKLAAFDEEKLLFALLVGAATEQLYCCYQRSDDAGRTVAPSWYLTELRRALRAEGADCPLQEKTIPRGILEKKTTEHFNRSDLLLPEELAIRLGLESQDPTRLVELFSPLASVYKRGRRAMRQTETPAGRLAGYDGQLGRFSSYWERLRQQGISPTALESYALCPFQFFARNILGLGRLERPEEMTAPAPPAIGEILHRILRAFYRELIDRNAFSLKEPLANHLSLLEDTAQRIFSDYELSNPVGLPVAWEIVREELMEILHQALRQDLQELSQSGYRPVTVEIASEAPLRGKWPTFLAGVILRGRMDRIDHHPGENRYRVIDYKFKSGRNPAPQDKNLARSALRGERLQPPLYLLLGKRFAAARGDQAPGPNVAAAFYFLAPKWPDGPLITRFFPADAWEGKMGAELRETLSYLLQGIRQGQFFIHPGSYCGNCEVSEVCRKNHLPTSWRAESDPATRPHHDLRQKEAPK